MRTVLFVQQFCYFYLFQFRVRATHGGRFGNHSNHSHTSIVHFSHHIITYLLHCWYRYNFFLVISIPDTTYTFIFRSIYEVLRKEDAK